MEKVEVIIVIFTWDTDKFLCDSILSWKMWKNLNSHRNDCLSPPSHPKYVDPEVEDRQSLGNTTYTPQLCTLCSRPPDLYDGDDRLNLPPPS